MPAGKVAIFRSDYGGVDVAADLVLVIMEAAGYFSTDRLRVW